MDYKERFKTIELFEEDKWQVTYLAFDKLKKTNCYYICHTLIILNFYYEKSQKSASDLATNLFSGGRYFYNYFCC